MFLFDSCSGVGSGVVRGRLRLRVCVVCVWWLIFFFAVRLVCLRTLCVAGTEGEYWFTVYPIGSGLALGSSRLVSPIVSVLAGRGISVSMCPRRDAGEVVAVCVGLVRKVRGGGVGWSSAGAPSSGS